jgi:uncharacterized protein YndB with AHSA1/START domain
MRSALLAAVLVLALAAREGLRVEVGADPDGASGLIRGVVDIPAPPQAVWAVLVDCALAPRMVRSLKTCRILERDPAGRWDVREHVSRGGLIPSVRSVFRSDYEPPWRIRFRRAGGDLKVLEGEWRLLPLEGGGTRVFYESRASAPFAVPPPLARMVLRRDVPDALRALRREALARESR